MERETWYIANVPRYNKDIIKNKILHAKLIVFVFVLNPAILVSGIIKLHLHLDWVLFSSSNSSVRAVLTMLHLIYVVISCGVIYSQILIHVYLNIYVKTQMEALTMYFEDLSLYIPSVVNGIKMIYVYDKLIKGVRQHSHLLRYVLITF